MTDEALPRAVAVAWGVTVAPQRGPKRELSHERIVEAAVEIADAEGLESVTMQRVAQAFGFTTMALYRYVAGKDELHQLMSDAVVDQSALAAVPSHDWRAGVRAWAAVLRGVYRAHPWLLLLPTSAEQLLMPGSMAVVDAGMRALRGLALSVEEQLGVIVSLSVLIRGYAAAEAEMFGGTSDAAPAPALMAAIREVATAERFPDLAPLVADGSYFTEPGAPSADGTGPVDGELDSGLEIFLAGLAALVERREPAAEQPAPGSPQG